GQGRSAVIFASGFFDPTANNGGEGFGIFAAGPGGKVYELRADKSKGNGSGSMARTGGASLSPNIAAPGVSAIAGPEFGLAAPRPNPATGPVRISFALDRETDVRLAVFDIRGRLVETLRSGRFAAGSYDVAIDASRLSSGVYLYRLDAGARSETRKLIVTR
ncbi:MAG: T9SS type A sorting domain-containing protein, partial [Gemmatimonadetes bacterium]|nr:T9SS type A sorting domain-containing protein [Gemmatimonadota bacterium]